jgi:hypothetical protein
MQRGRCRENICSFWRSFKIFKLAIEKATITYSGTAQGMTWQLAGAAGGELEVSVLAWVVEEANEAGASDAGLSPALTATGEGEVTEAAPARRSAAHVETEAAGRLTF